MQYAKNLYGSGRALVDPPDFKSGRGVRRASLVGSIPMRFRHIVIYYQLVIIAHTILFHDNITTRKDKREKLKSLGFESYRLFVSIKP